MINKAGKLTPPLSTILVSILAVHSRIGQIQLRAATCRNDEKLNHAYV